MRWFGVGLGLAGWLCSGYQSLSPVLAQNASCTVSASTPSSLIASSFTSFGAMPKAMQSAGSSYFQVVCPGNASRTGSITLLIVSPNTYNGIPQLRVLGADGIFVNGGTNYGDSFTIPFSTSGTTQGGNVYYQVLVAAPDSKSLRAATDYTVAIKADLIAN